MMTKQVASRCLRLAPVGLGLMLRKAQGSSAAIILRCSSPCSISSALSHGCKPLHDKRFSATIENSAAGLGDVSQPTLITAGVFQWNQTEIASDLLATLKAIRLADDQHERHRGQWTDARMDRQSLRLGALLHFLLRRLAQLRDHRMAAAVGDQPYE